MTRSWLGLSPSVALPALLAMIGGCATPPADPARPPLPAELTRQAPPAGGARPAPPVSALPGGALGRLAAGRPGALAVGDVQTGDADAAGSRFAVALRAALATDLRAIGVLDVGAPTRLDAVVARRAGDAEARVTVTRAGQTRLKKRYRLDLPRAAASDEAAAVRSLLGEVYDDPEFDLAIRD